MTQPLCFDNAKGTLRGFKTRDQKTKDKESPGMDLAIEIKGRNDVLAYLDPQMRSLFYRAPEPVEGEIEGATDVSSLTQLAMGLKVDKFDVNVELVGGTLVVEYGTNKEPIRLEGIKIPKVYCVLYDGGTVMLKFQVKANITDDQVKRLNRLVGAEIVFSVLPPGVDQAELNL